ncbi:MAG: dihydrofolate reductase [Sphingomonadaceae bacterium]|nr:dihydrofolate reductase [Sphingomonadaceae bacterium]
MSGLFIVAARARNGVIGRDNSLPWLLPADLRRFKALTIGGAMIMGRRTFESIGRPLPGRRTLILSRRGFSAPGTETAASLADALALAGDGAAVVGGEAVFADALPLAARLELTEVHAEPDGDAWFPPFDEVGWRESWREEHPASDGQPGFTFRTLLRR